MNIRILFLIVAVFVSTAPISLMANKPMASVYYEVAPPVERGKKRGVLKKKKKFRKYNKKKKSIRSIKATAKKRVIVCLILAGFFATLATGFTIAGIFMYWTIGFLVPGILLFVLSLVFFAIAMGILAKQKVKRKKYFKETSNLPPLLFDRYIRTKHEIKDVKEAISVYKQRETPRAKNKFAHYTKVLAKEKKKLKELEELNSLAEDVPKEKKT